MTTYENVIRDRLHSAAEQISTTSRLQSITVSEIDAQETGVQGNGAHARERSSALASLKLARGAGPHPLRKFAIAAAVGFVLAGWLIAALQRDQVGEQQVAASADSVVELNLAETAAEPVDLVPAIPTPPAKFGEGRRGERKGGFRVGQWTSVALAKVVDGRLLDPVVVSVVRGDAAYLQQAEPLDKDVATAEIGELVAVENGPWLAIARTGAPIVIVTGAVDQATLLGVFAALNPAEPEGRGVLLKPEQLPAGYSLIVEPTVLGEDRNPRRVLADEFRSVSINEISDLVHPLLAAANGGGDLQPIEVGDADGWTATYEDDEFGSLRSLVWAPQPGVVLEISAVTDRWSLEESIELAEMITMITPEAWDQQYPD